ncbi:MAG: Gmad2 immunoglobulin-like domain-containing protein, partial [Chloroflexota bacterium]
APVDSPPAGLVVKAFNEAETVLFGQSSSTTADAANPWSTNIVLGPLPPLGSTGHLVAYMLDPNTAAVIATSPAITVTYGTPVPPTPTSTATATTTPTATATTPLGTPGISVASPTAGATVDPIAGVLVSGNVTDAPDGATVLVRLRNASGETLDEKGYTLVPGQPNQGWSLTVAKSTGVATTGNGDLFAFLILSGSTIAQTNAIPLNFTGAPPQTAVTITSPANGATLSRTAPNAIAGTTANLPGGATVLVQAFVNGSGSPIGQQTATLNGNNWTANLSITTPVSAGSAGTLRAFAMSGNTVIASSNIVNVIYGTPSGAPFVQITVPAQNSVVAVGGSPIQLFGLAGNLPQNSIIVRALDTFGNILSQVTSSTDGAGNWSAQLLVNVPAGTPGTLYAFVMNPQNSAIVASSRVNVFYGGQCFVRTDWPVYVVQVGDTLLRIAQRVGSTVTELAYANCIPNANLVFVGQQLRVPRLPVTPQPAQATLRIITPVQNATLDTSQRVTVTGAGRQLAGNDVVVRALDANGNLLAQQTTRVGTAGGDGESQWQVSLSILAQDGTRGSIYAFAQTPGTGTVLADALIDVNFSGSVVVVPPPQNNQRLFIIQPASDASVTPSGQVQVTGQILGAFEGNLWVLALDNKGNTIAEAEAAVSPANAQEQADWLALLTIHVDPGTRGTIYAYVSAPFATEMVLADSVNVVFGEAGTGPYVTITDPMPYSILVTTNPLLISGRGGRLFEGNVQVQALDAEGNVLAESFTTINSPDAGTGGEGDWQLSLPVSVAPGTRGTIIAFSTSAQDGSVVASASIYVTYGDPTSVPNFVRINTPLANATVDPSNTVLIAGTADDSSVSTVTVQILDDADNVLVEQPRNLNPAVDGDFGVWQMLVELSSMAPGTHLRINALTISGGVTLASDSIEFVVGVPTE